jgi:hypothetical protein
MGWRDDVSNFDLGRFTLMGWLIFLLSVAVGIGAAIVVGSSWDSLFPPQPGASPRRTGPTGIAGIAGALGCFFGMKVLLNMAGVSLMSPKQENPEENDDDEEDERRPRQQRRRRHDDEEEDNPRPQKKLRSNDIEAKRPPLKKRRPRSEDDE